MNSSVFPVIEFCDMANPSPDPDMSPGIPPHNSCLKPVVKNSFVIRCSMAPKARLTPISCVLWLTVFDMTP